MKTLDEGCGKETQAFPETCFFIERVSIFVERIKSLAMSLVSTVCNIFEDSIETILSNGQIGKPTVLSKITLNRALWIQSVHLKQRASNHGRDYVMSRVNYYRDNPDQIQVVEH